MTGSSPRPATVCSWYSTESTPIIRIHAIPTTRSPGRSQPKVANVFEMFWLLYQMCVGASGVVHVEGAVAVGNINGDMGLGGWAYGGEWVMERWWIEGVLWVLRDFSVMNWTAQNGTGGYSKVLGGLHDGHIRTIMQD